MAVAVQLDFDGATLDQYDAICKLMGLTPKGPGPVGAISHFATMTESELRVVDAGSRANSSRASPRSRSAPTPSRWASPASQRIHC